jgi:hypothetical protein
MRIHVLVSTSLVLATACATDAPSGPPSDSDLATARRASAVLVPVRGLGIAAETAAQSGAPMADTPEGDGCTAVSTSESTLTVAWTQCVLPTGEILDGSVSMSLTLVPLRASVVIDDVRLGASTFSGSATLSITGTLPDLTIQLAGELAVNAASISIDDLAVAGSGGALTIDGGAELVDPSGSIGVDADRIRYDHACLPAAGSLSFTSPGSAGTITFLSTTPADGIVSLEVPPLAPTNIALFAACPH